jgi:hypothetical protein
MRIASYALLWVGVVIADSVQRWSGWIVWGGALNELDIVRKDRKAVKQRAAKF